MKTLLLALMPMVLCAAEPVVDQVFDDPEQLAAVVNIAPGERLEIQNIASGSGAKTSVIISPVKDAGSGTPGKPAVEFPSDPAFGGNRFFRSNIDPQGDVRSIHLIVNPTDPRGGLSSLIKSGNGNSTVSGGFDFFFRIGCDGGGVAPAASLWVVSRLVGVTIAPSSDGQGLLLGMFAPSKVLSCDSAEPAGMVQGKKLSAIALDGGGVYHAAVRFTTDGDGLICARLFVKEGVGPIDVESGDGLHGEIDALRIMTSDELEDDSDKFAFELARKEFPQTFELARFRLYTTPPDKFPGLNP
jgi:hypothetical protein